MKKMLLKDNQVAIIGGGPGGLTLARLLQQRGVSVKVYERDINKDARIQGAIVDLHFESGLRALSEAGLMDAFKANFMSGADRYRIVDKHGEIRYDEQASVADFDNKQFRPEIDRGTLRNILLKSLQPGTVIWDSQFVGMAQVDKGWQLKFKNGTTATVNIVIGSDGASSKTRPYVTDIMPHYAGVTIIQGEIDNPEKDCPEISRMVNKATLAALGDGKTIAMQPRGDGGLIFYGSAKYPENWIADSGINFSDKREVTAYLEKFYEGWNPVFFTLFKASGRFVPRPLNCIPLDQNWNAHTNLTLIGDAAHLMPPSGEGVNLAMLDALELSECLTSGDYNDTRAAIAAYEQPMRARAAKEAEDSLEMMDWMRSNDALPKLVQLLNYPH